MSNAVKMGTSTTGSELHSDKLAKLQARRKELETLLAAKNEELYKLCVQEVQLTGVMPPEAPVETGNADNSSVTVSENREPETVFRKDPVDRKDRARHAHRQTIDKGKDLLSSRKQQICHRLSTPSISGLSVKSAPTRRSEHPSASCSTLVQAQDERDTYSMHSSQTYPSLPASNSTRHHTLTSEQVHKLYYNTQGPDGIGFSRVHETHFSSSQPDITTRSSHCSLVISPSSHVSHNQPLVFQYAEQLRARSTHLSGVRPRRNTLQRTQTYHLTGHSEHVPLHDNMAALSVAPQSPPYHPPPPPPVSPYHHHYPHMSPVASYLGQYGDSPDQKVKEKEWYESSLDSPSSSSGVNLSKESIQYHSPKKALSRTPSAPSPPPPLTPPTTANAPSPLPDVAFESPKNITVVESGKWIPYREVSKPFEMADFYKYSTKFRQNNNNTQKPRPLPNTSNNPYPSSPEEIRYAQQ